MVSMTVSCFCYRCRPVTYNKAFCISQKALHVAITGIALDLGPGVQLSHIETCDSVQVYGYGCTEDVKNAYCEVEPALLILAGKALCLKC